MSIRQIVRGLGRSPVFSLTVIGCLALGLTANASVLTILNAVVLRPLPYPQSSELLHLGLGDGTVANLPVPGSEYRDWMTQNRSLAASATYHQVRATTDGSFEPEEVVGASVSVDFAHVLLAEPVLGRFLSAGDDRLGDTGPVVLANAYWVNRFGGDSNIVGRSMRLSGRNVTVIGVMPPGFDFPHGSQFWRAEPPPTGAAGEYYTIVARRLPGVSPIAVTADLARIPRRFAGDLPRIIVEARPTVELLQDRLYGSAKPVVLMLFAAATLLLVIGGAGVANLVLARNASRASEFSLRVALGATTARVVVPIIAECVILSLIAGTIGVLMSMSVSQIFVHIGPPILEQLGSIDLDWRVLLIMFVWTLATGVMVGVLASLQAARRAAFPGDALKGRIAGAGRFFSAARRALVVAQIAIAMLLITGAGLLSTSLSRVSNIPRGFDAENVVIASVILPRGRYESNGSVRNLFDAVRQSLLNTPGVLGVASGTPPMSGFDEMMTSHPDGSGRSYSIATNPVGPGYFSTYRIPLLSGRVIDANDNATSEPVVVINQAAKNMIFPDRSPLGESIAAMTVRGQHPTVVGVVADVPQYDVAMRAQAAAYAPYAQVDGRPTEIAVRTHSSAAVLVDPIRRLLSEHDAQAAARFSFLEDIVSRSVAPRLFTATLAGGFAVLALLIATIGLLGLLSYLATQRAHEMGIRVALGARRIDIVKLMLREGLLLAGAGLALGGILTLALNGFLASLIFELEPRDPAVLLAAAALVGGVTFAATLAPALRASVADPMTALRHD